MKSNDLWKNSWVSDDETHHEKNGGPLYPQRFEKVLSFHDPGLAPVKKNGKWFHIIPDGSKAYSRAFDQAFGFYDERASVESGGEWFHIKPDGSDAYERRFSWCGNFQQGLCTVRDKQGLYHHITPEGEDAYSEKYLYAGDFREGVAVVKRWDGLCQHIRTNSETLHDRLYVDLGVYHKGYATAKDSFGWFHIDKNGKPRYKHRYHSAEPFYNGLALCATMSGNYVRIDASGKEVEKINPPKTRSTGKKILIIGNLSSGKTTLGRELAKRLGFEILRIDDCRRLMADGSVSGEYRAWSKFAEYCESNKDCILEFSGGGPHVFNIGRALELSGAKTYLIWLDATLDECIARSKERTFDSPYPYALGDLTELIKHIDREIKTAWENVWTKKGFKTLRIKNPGRDNIQQAISLLGDEL